MSNKTIIGLTGPFGSGCTYIAHDFFEPAGYQYLSLSEILKGEYKNEFKKEDPPTRTELQDFGNKLREKEGTDVLAKRACRIINKRKEEKWVIDSIRNTHEIEFLKKAFGSTYIIAAWAEQETRWGRVEGKYNRNRVAFEADD